MSAHGWFNIGFCVWLSTPLIGWCAQLVWLYFHGWRYNISLMCLMPPVDSGAYDLTTPRDEPRKERR
jgi:hypothetical protein